MNIIKEMHLSLHNEERDIENQEARVNAMLRDINIRRGNLSLKRIELAKVQAAVNEQERLENAPPGGWLGGPDAGNRAYHPSFKDAQSTLNKNNA